MNYENHRFAKEGEAKCDTCASFNGLNACLSCDTHITYTFHHQTCKYHIPRSNFLNVETNSERGTSERINS